MVGPRTRWVHKEEDCDFSLLNFFEEKKEEIVFDFSPVLLTIERSQRMSGAEQVYRPSSKLFIFS